MKMRLTAIVTGANRGLGKAIVKKMAKNGYDIWACARTPDDSFEAYIDSLQQEYGIIVKPVYFDLQSEKAVKQGYKRICEDKRNIDVLINNAGIGHMELFQMTKISRVKEIFEVNLLAPMYLSQLVIQNMRKQRKGKIINIASTAAKEIYVGNAVYGASKAALVAFTQSLASEVAQYGITVNAVAPGLLQTDMSRIFEGKDPKEPLKHTALGRKILPEEIAEVIMGLLNEKMLLINGEVIYVNGGHK